MNKLSKIGVLLTTIPLTLLLVVIILCSTVENVHSTLLDIGESQWTGYSELRQPPVKPDCDPDAKPEPAPAAEEDDLLDDLFGEEEEVSADAQNAAREICLAKFEKYENLVKRQEDSGLQAFVSFEGAVGHIATSSVGFVKEFLILIFIFCGLAVTLQRQHLGLRSPRTRRDDRVSQIAQLIGNLIVIFSFLAYYKQDIASGVDNVSNLPIYWMIGFGLMALANILLLFIPLKEGDGEPAKSSIGQMMLGIPLYAYMAWICGLYFGIVEQHFAGVAIYLNQMTEHANLYSNVALYVFSGMMLKYTDIADKFFAIIRPLKLSPELLAIAIVLLSAIPTAYSGASGIFVIAAGAIIYRELKRAEARDTLALAATAMSGSMGIVLSPCLLVVIIAALNKDVTTTELFHAGFNVFLVNIFVFVLVIYWTKHEQFHWAFSLDGKKNKTIFKNIGKAIVPVLPYIGIGAAVLLLFRFGIGAKFNEYSAAWLLPFVLIVLLIYDRIIAKRAFIKGEDSPDDAEALKESDASESGKSLKEAEETAETKETLEQLEETEETATETLKEAETATSEGSKTATETSKTAPDGILKSLFNAANSTAVSSGGLLALMTLSICVGGIIDRAHLNELLPQQFGGDFHAVMAMGMLFIILVFIGMIMDPYGAVILVSATLTQIASANGIDPVHFWVTVLCAFELGYLTPPVALNQLLTRQVVGDKAYAFERAEDRPTKFWNRHERILLPVAVKATVLLLVAFGPLIINIIRWKLR
ncbi:MAG: TRAP transporter large permease subunit [Proteobacteria bacterium]|nr:TRAP transporter large permease subunit [Pseudomonadota bacterium]